MLGSAIDLDLGLSKLCFVCSLRAPCRPLTVAFQNHDEDISMSWFAVTDGAHKLIQVIISLMNCISI